MAGTRRTIGIDQLDNFSLDDDLILYWDGEQIQTLSKFSLPWWINVAVGITALSAAVTAIAEITIAFHLV